MVLCFCVGVGPRLVGLAGLRRLLLAACSFAVSGVRGEVRMSLK